MDHQKHVYLRNLKINYSAPRKSSSECLKSPKAACDLQDEHKIDQIEAIRLLICVTHFNDPDGFFCCIDSILAHQILSSHCSIFIVDDNSDIEVYEQVEMKVKNHQYIEIVRAKVNGGPSVSRNLGIQYAIYNKWTHLCFIDSDDRIESSIAAAGMEFNDITFFGFSIESMDDFGGVTVRRFPADCVNDISIEFIKYLESPNKSQHLTRCWGKVYSVDVLHRENLRFDPRMRTYEDVKFLLSFLVKARRIDSTTKSFYVHTIRSKRRGATFGVANRLVGTDVI